ncbi:hypothetical protein H0E84_15205 [Luteimonas sp. SJ-92]|uniref:Uncharacterized protein n=1 Tax=Luteimonas salinisoli TaxID=2752307 RepID=A0A853JGN3_9GAMM|nr:hypothetical protein [Luteimonas salinisoli]NZA27727.1 hypothetical protein [Luteimonas salinisoli]
MSTYICLEFLRDLVEHNEAHFASRVLSKIVDGSGDFVPDADDHDYDGIEDARIRYISRGRTAFRAIFVRRDGHIYWYRAGNHSIEDRLQPPTRLDRAIEVRAAPQLVDLHAQYAFPNYLKSTEQRLLREVIASRVLVPHRSLTLVTPRISDQLFSPIGLIGRLISSVIELGGSVTLITAPPSERELRSYRWLVQRGVDLLVHPELNVRFLLFEVDHSNLDQEMRHIDSIAIIGSAELTQAGLGDGAAGAIKEELCYQIGPDDLDGSSHFILHLADKALDLETHIRRSN